MQRVANFQARSAKNKMKPKKMKAMSEFDQGMYNNYFIIGKHWYYCSYLYIIY